MIDLHKLDKFRLKDREREFYGCTGDSGNGVFKVYVGGKSFRVIASNGMGWEHVSVSPGSAQRKCCPTWDEMCAIAVSEDVKMLVEKELESANERFPQFHSEHEGWAVMQEEAEELREEYDSIEMAMEQLWHRIRDGIPTSLQVALVGQYAEAAACEAIQVAAMARKYLDMLERMDE